MSTGKIFFTMLFASLIGGAISIAGYKYFIAEEQEQSFQEKQQVVLSKFSESEESKKSISNSTTSQQSKSNYIVPEGLNFVTAAERVTPAVVHIKTTYNGTAASYGRNSIDDMIREFFGENGDEDYYNNNRRQRMSSGSGVIITDDGYIATNNHVVENASSIEVVLNDKRSYEATIVGTDPTTDLALIKVSGDDLPFVPFGNSDEVKIGEWVLAVGNPFDLTSTVTAGIVSAKARNINILRGRSQYSIESFIQTDAAVNPGNSGGALVDLNGNLIGINTAIATNTGSYSGYSFAVPVTLVKKVMDDLVSYGEVQRALMGVSILDINADVAEEFGIDEIRGVYINGVSAGGGADDAGIVKGDIILSIDDYEVNDVSALQEVVARNRPGDEINVKIKRNGEIEIVRVTLKNKRQTTEIITKEDNEEALIPELGAEVQDVSNSELSELGLNSGIKVAKLKEGKLKAANVQEGFIITHVDKQPVSNAEELKAIFNTADGGMLIEGIYPDGEKAYYGIGF